MEHVKQFRQGQQGKNATRSPGVGVGWGGLGVGVGVGGAALLLTARSTSSLFCPPFPQMQNEGLHGTISETLSFLFYGHMKIKRNSPLPRPPHAPSIEHNFYSTPNPHRVFLLPRLRPATLGLEMLRAVPRAFRFMI